MTQFDFIDSAGKAYLYVWRERETVFRMAWIALAIKALSLFAVVLMGYEDHILRVGLLLLPSQFIEGLVVCQILVMAIHEKSLETLYKSRLLAAPPILGGAILYVLIKMASAAVMAMSYNKAALVEATGGPVEAPEPSAYMFTLALLMMAILIWMFRLIWVYVPAALGYRVGDYLERFKSYSASFPMIGVWLFCFVPIGVAYIVLRSFVEMGFPEQEGAGNYAYHAGVSIVEAVTDFVLSLLSSLGIGYGIHSVMSGKSKNNKR